MLYNSTRNKENTCTASQAILKGIASDGGLYVPQTMPALQQGAIEELCKMDYSQRAVYILKMFLDDYSTEELAEYVSKAYNADSFDVPEIVPLKGVDNDTYLLELWHGPTCAFKDMALQLLPYLMTAALRKNGEQRKVCILTATSGDTGKAALEAFSDVADTKIMVFYPENGVSQVQRLQMTTQKGTNVSVCAVKGNFDDAQNGVKAIFGDKALNEKLSENGWILSSANSINWGRLLPQIVYYISAYCDLVNSGRISVGEKIQFVVPTGNFGDILAGFYAKKIGLPVSHLICASNANDVLTDFIKTGTYDRRRSFHTTISPSMDILISSNLERLLFHLSGSDDETAGYMRALSQDGCYTISANVKADIDELFSGGYLSDDDTKQVIKEYFDKYNCLIDTHTAVGCGVLNEYRKKNGTQTAVVASTANPYKFCGSVLDALGVSHEDDGVVLFAQLEKASGTDAPKPLKTLGENEVRFTNSVEKEMMPQAVTDFLR